VVNQSLHLRPRFWWFLVLKWIRRDPALHFPPLPAGLRDLSSCVLRAAQWNRIRKDRRAGIARIGPSASMQRPYQNVKGEHPRITSQSFLRHYFSADRRTTRGAVTSAGRSLTETRMRKAAFTVLGVLLIAGSAMQMATASEHHTRTARSHHRWDRTYNQLKEPGFAVPQMRDGYSEGSKPDDGNKSCDRLWCYSD
jgi:hypothetical protein